MGLLSSIKNTVSSLTKRKPSAAAAASIASSRATSSMEGVTGSASRRTRTSASGGGGSSGGSREQRDAAKLKKQERYLSGKMSNEQSNISILKNNLRTASEKSKVKLQAQIDKKQKRIDDWSAAAALLGVKPNASVSDVGNGTFIPTAYLSRDQRQTAAAERQGLIERAAGIATNVVGGTQATAENVAPPRVATTLTNEIDARDFAEQEPEISVGDVANNAGTSASPVFMGPDGRALYYIPAGTNQPARITDPAQLETLVKSGAVAPGDASTYKKLSEANDWLAGQEGGAVEETVVSEGGNMDLANQFNEALEPYRDAVTKMQQEVLGFDQSDYQEIREAAEQKTGLDDIMDSMSRTNSALADLLSIQDRVPQTTLAAIQGTSVTQGVLDRQRANILGDLATAIAPLERVKTALQSDYDARVKLVDDAVQSQKDADSFKLQKLGYALDYATSNYTMAADQAQVIFDAASKDYENRVKAAEQAAKDQKEALKEQNKAMADFYESQGYVIDPETGELAETLALKNYRKGGSGGGGKETAQDYAAALMRGTKTIDQVPVKLQTEVEQIILNSGVDVVKDTSGYLDQSDYPRLDLTRSESSRLLTPSNTSSETTRIDKEAAAIEVSQNPNISLSELIALYPSLSISDGKALLDL